MLWQNNSLQGAMSLEKLPDILDNSEGKKVAEVLRVFLNSEKPPSSLRAVTAYFNLGGFGILHKGLNNPENVKILLGKEQEREFVIGERLRGELEIALNHKETPPLIKEFEQFLIQNKVEVKAFKKKFLHGKAYIIEGIPYIGGIGIVGSSNFTEAGLKINFELNAVLKQESAVRELVEWFERFWNEAEDYKVELLELIKPFTTNYLPYEIYMKTLYEYFKDRLETGVSPEDERPSPIVLADFQRDGYLIAEEILEKYGGVILADSVGFGKTFLALKILDDYAYQLRQKALLICPAQLAGEMGFWNRRLKDSAIRVDIETMEQVSRSNFRVEDYADYDLVVVDESHNFRNSSANRWDALFRLITTGKQKKIVLLTATPVNNTIFDLYNQLRFITRDRDDFFLASGIKSLWGYFLQAEANKDVLYEVLEEISVRRSREFIRKNYPDAKIDGEPVKFPERELHRVDYSLESSYKGLYDEITKSIENLFFAPYNIESWRLGPKQMPLFEGMKDELKRQGWTEDQAQNYLEKLGRGLALVGIMKVLFLKRLESSIQALHISIDRQIRFQEKFLELLNLGRLLDASTYRRLISINLSDDAGESDEDLETEIILQLSEVDKKIYDLEGVKRAVKEDLEMLVTVKTNLERLDYFQDNKLSQLKRLLLGELKGKKVIIFSYFKDTARYLYHQLGGRLADGSYLPQGEAFIKQLGHEKISIVDSIVKPAERADRIIRFAPVANERPDIKGSDMEIDLLISTDVLSEGQNLQDADTLINYDLHWNPVRMVQRAGRIDRLNSPYDAVHVYNFVPEDALESLLGIMDRLYEKLEAIGRTVGLDASVLGERPSPQEFNAIRKIAEGDSTLWDELEGMSELDVGEFLKQELLDFLKKVGEERLKHIPIGMGSGMQRTGKKGLFAAIKDEKNKRHFWLFYDLNEKKIINRKLDALKLIRCQPEEKRVEPDFDIYEIIDLLKQYIVRQTKQMTRKVEALPSPQNQVMNWLQSQSPTEERNKLIGYFSKPVTGVAIKELRNLWKEVRTRKISMEDSIKLLNDLAYKFPHPEIGAPTLEELKQEDLQIISWIALC